MSTFINEAVLSLPEQVEKNKEDIKAIEETIGGIDPNLINQVHTNTNDITAIKQEQIVQNTAINQNGGKITALETKTSNINANGDEYSNVEKVANVNSDMEITASGLTIESTDILDIFTPNANINVDNGGLIKISNDNNSNKLEYDGANGSFKVSGGHTLEFDSATGDLTIDGGAVGGGALYRHHIYMKSYITTSVFGIFNFDIYTTSDTPLGYDGVNSYLTQNNITNANNYIQGYRESWDSSKIGFYYGIYAQGSDIMAVQISSSLTQAVAPRSQGIYGNFVETITAC